MAEVEIGISSNPLVFTGVIAGEEFLHPNNPFYLWNDKGGLTGAVDAKQLTMSVLGLNIVDEFVGLSNETPAQSFTVAFFPIVENDISNTIAVKVNGVIWTRTFSLATAEPSDEVYSLDATTGVIRFGDNIHGKIPELANTITITYTPDKKEFGTEVEEFNWLGVRSTGVIRNNISVLLERQTSLDTLTVTVAHWNIVSVAGVYLNEDSHRLGTNYYTGGSFNTALGRLTLGTALPANNTGVLIDYVYTIADDAEAGYTQIGGSVSHTFLNPIPSNNAKQIYFRIVAPATASPSGSLNLRFRIRLDFNS